MLSLIRLLWRLSPGAAAGGDWALTSRLQRLWCRWDISGKVRARWHSTFQFPAASCNIWRWITDEKKCVNSYFSRFHSFTPGTRSPAYCTVVSIKLVSLLALVGLPQLGRGDICLLWHAFWAFLSLTESSESRCRVNFTNSPQGAITCSPKSKWMNGTLRNNGNMSYGFYFWQHGFTVLGQILHHINTSSAGKENVQGFE